jgi:hypothetical protein
LAWLKRRAAARAVSRRQIEKRARGLPNPMGRRHRQLGSDKFARYDLAPLIPLPLEDLRGIEPDDASVVVRSRVRVLTQFTLLWLHRLTNDSFHFPIVRYLPGDKSCGQTTLVGSLQ